MKRGLVWTFVVGGLLLFGLLRWRSTSEQTPTTAPAPMPNAVAEAATNLPASRANQTVTATPSPLPPSTPTPPAPDLTKPFTAFSDWAQRWLTNDPAADAI